MGGGSAPPASGKAVSSPCWSYNACKSEGLPSGMTESGSGWLNKVIDSASKNTGMEMGDDTVVQSGAGLLRGSWPVFASIIQATMGGSWVLFVSRFKITCCPAQPRQYQSNRRGQVLSQAISQQSGVALKLSSHARTAFPSNQSRPSESQGARTGVSATAWRCSVSLKPSASRDARGKGSTEGRPNMKNPRF